MGLGSNDYGPDTQYESPFGGHLTWVGTLLSYLYLVMGPILYLGFIMMFASYKLYAGAVPEIEEVFSVFIATLLLFVIGGLLVALGFWLLREGPRRFAPGTRVWMASLLFLVLGFISYSMYAQPGAVSDDTYQTMFSMVLVTGAWAVAMFVRAAIENARTRDV